MLQAEGGVPGIDMSWLLERASEADGCLEWLLCCLGGRAPIATVQGVRVYVRRLLWEVTRERPVRTGMDVVAKCGNERCVHPDCLAERTPRHRTAGVPKTAAHRMRTAMAARARSKMTMQQVRDIRASDATNAEFESTYGLYEGHASALRTGAVWRDFASPWAALEAG